MSMRTVAPGAAQPLQRSQRVAHDEAGALPDVGVAMRFVDDTSRRAALKCGSHEIMTVIVLALDGKEELAFFQGPRIDRDAADARRQRAADACIEHADKRKACPQGNTHAACSLSASRIASWSEKGSTLSPTICPVS